MPGPPRPLHHLLRRLAAIALTLAGTSMEARGQFLAGAEVREGTPLRVYVLDEPPRESAFAYASPSALHVRARCDSCTHVVAIPWNVITRVDAGVAGPSSARRALVGGLVGGSATVVALALVLASGGARCDWDGGACPAIGIVQTAPLLVAAGTGLGVIVGSQMRDRMWVTIRVR